MAKFVVDNGQQQETPTTFRLSQSGDNIWVYAKNATVSSGAEYVLGRFDGKTGKFHREPYIPVGLGLKTTGFENKIEVV